MSNVDTIHDTGETPIILPKPVAVPVTHYVKEPALVVFTKFLSWLTAVLLAVAVIISLVSVTSERDDLRNQLSGLTEEIACRASANADVSRASAVKQIAVAEHSILVGRFITLVSTGDRESPEYLTDLQDISADLTALNVSLDDAVLGLQEALDDLDAALITCPAD